MTDRKFHFVLSAARDNMYDRLLIDGVADFARTCGECRFSLAKPDLRDAKIERYPPDGIICRVFDTRTAALLERLRLPTVDLFGFTDWTGKSSVVADDRLIGRLAAEHFLERRFRNFAFFGYRNLGYSERRRDGFLARLAESGLDARVFETEAGGGRTGRDPRIPSYRNATLHADRNLVRRLSALPKPVAAFCCHDPKAVSVLEACRVAEIAVPNEVAILGVDDDTVCCEFSSPRLSSVNPNSRKIGFEAARKLLELAKRPARERTHGTWTIPPLGVTVRESSEVYPLNPKWLSDALVYIRRNAVRGISASDVFAALGLSHTLVQKTFRAQLGTTVQREIVTARMDESRRLLKDSRLPVSEIATQCGFTSLHYFSQAFTSTYGMSPQVWRNGLKA